MKRKKEARHIRSQRAFVRGCVVALGVTVLSTLALQASIRRGSSFPSTTSTRVYMSRRSLDESDEPEKAKFCSAQFETVQERISNVSASVKEVNDWINRTSESGRCKIDFSNYESYPSTSIDPCTPGGVLFYTIGLLYMFAGLAIVCDEFFVPALDVMVERFALSNDVAGATLMAAGGSAPELFTSLVGTFVAETNVGFGTIVGSAVFNVLFVIGMCAIFSKEVLHLTWWPLARDSTYYAFSLCVLAVFCTTGKEIEAWEAIVLFLMYLGYVTIMKYNHVLQGKVSKLFGRQNKVLPNEFVQVDETSKYDRRQSSPFLFHNKFRSGLLHIMYKELNTLDQVRIRLVCDIQGGVKETFERLDLDQSGDINKHELATVLGELHGQPPTPEELEKVFEELQVDPSEGINLATFTKWYQNSEERVLAEVKRFFAIADTSNDGFLDRSEVVNVIRALEEEHGKEESIETREIERAMDQFDLDENGRISFDEFFNWFNKSILWKQILEEATDAEEDSGPLDLSWPETNRARVMYVLTAPVVFPLYFTIPDVRRQGWDKYYPFTWSLAICWIAVFAYLMVWWAVLLGDAAELPPSVMGVTFLAAGTSIPDLITSVIVARQGFGDMAVSSSIGSNIFDVLVGLPVPWILYTLINGRSLKVVDETVLVSLMVLILMLVTVIVIIAVSKWRMTKTMGFGMLALYFVFVAIDLFRQLAGCK